MFKNKLFLNGLGIGLIMGAILLQIMISVSQADRPRFSEEKEGLEQPPDNTDTLRKMADELGYQVYEKDVKLYTQAQIDQLFTQEQVDELIHKEQGTAKESFSPSSKVILTIPPGSSSSEVGDILVQFKLITDKKAFEEELIEKQLASKIQAGEYEWETNPTLDKIIKAITNTH